MPLPPQPFIADAHQDIAWHCLENGRDLLGTPGIASMITLPRLQAAGVRLICATLFSLPGRPVGERYYQTYSQWEMYRQWYSQYPGQMVPVHSRSDLRRLAAAEPLPPATPEGQRRYPIGVILLMEGLDLLQGPADLLTWFGRGLRVASLTWYGANHFASGTSGDNRGLKLAGRELLREFEQLGMVLDLSHLNDAGVEDVFQHYGGALCASHSNARSIAAHERNLTDAQAHELAKRGGMIGLNLLATLLQRGWRKGDAMPPLAAATEHPHYLAQLIGHAHLGLGADLDGGLTAENTPEGINHVDDLPLLAADLGRRGWDEQQVAGFMGINWWRFFERCLPD
jgi:membrane dipeptidase